MKGLSAEQIAALRPRCVRWINGLWPIWAHDHQWPPEADWATWLILGGRGAGKTRAGAEWVRANALCNGNARIALIGETEHDVREVMIEGVSGLLAVHTRGERPQWISSRKRLEWKNGAVAQAFSAEEPESLRGPQFSAGGPFAKAAVDAYRAKLTADNTSEKIAAELAARELTVEQREAELATQTVIAEQGRWYTALPRPAFAFAFVIYVWKVVVWDKVLHLGTTDPLGIDMSQWAMIVLTAYFGDAASKR